MVLPERKIGEAIDKVRLECFSLKSKTVILDGTERPVQLSSQMAEKQKAHPTFRQKEASYPFSTLTGTTLRQWLGSSVASDPSQTTLGYKQVLHDMRQLTQHGRNLGGTIFQMKWPLRSDYGISGVAAMTLSNVYLPHKKPRGNRKLSEIQKAENKRHTRKFASRVVCRACPFWDKTLQRGDVNLARNRVQSAF